MKKQINLLAISVLSMFLLVGCGNDESTAQTESATSVPESTVSSIQKETVTVNISLQEDGKLVPDTDKELEIAEGSTLLDIMGKNYKIEETDTFINSIEGISQDEAEGKYWLFDVNGEAAPVGAADTILEAGDEVVWNLSGM
ncbi:DUF4430 domain-containing protein [Carnobacterium alterfunditum]|uniref:DUF4430 domain-containing protein n=1 Tax=Carnobacterium alterfunditum TaxID=28230 RepID=UPI00359423A2